MINKRDIDKDDNPYLKDYETRQALKQVAKEEPIYFWQWIMALVLRTIIEIPEDKQTDFRHMLETTFACILNETYGVSSLENIRCIMELDKKS